MATLQCGSKEKDVIIWINESYLAKKKKKKVLHMLIAVFLPSNSG